MVSSYFGFHLLSIMQTVWCGAELEVISVCWDALDGSTLYELLDGNSDLSNSSAYSIRLLMAAWYVSVGEQIIFVAATAQLTVSSAPTTWAA